MYIWVISEESNEIVSSCPHKPDYVHILILVNRTMALISAEENKWPRFK